MRITLILLLFIPISILSQVESSIIQFDPNYQIGWKDFKGDPDSESKNAANSYTGIDLAMKQRNDKLLKG